MQACLTVECKFPGLNATKGSFVYHDNHRDIQRWALAEHSCCSFYVIAAFHPLLKWLN